MKQEMQRCNHCVTEQVEENYECEKCGKDDALMYPFEPIALSTKESVMNKVYIVQGAGGEYEDFREWVVCAYASEEDAIQHAAYLNAVQEMYAKDITTLGPMRTHESILALQSRKDFREADPLNRNPCLDSMYDCSEVVVYTDSPFKIKGELICLNTQS
jgi:hypothetical protein